MQRARTTFYSTSQQLHLIYRTVNNSIHNNKLYLSCCCFHSINSRTSFPFTRMECYKWRLPLHYRWHEI